MKLEALFRRATARPPVVVTIPALRVGRVVHAIFDHPDLPREEVFVMHERTWAAIDEQAFEKFGPSHGCPWRVERFEEAWRLEGAVLVRPVYEPFQPILAEGPITLMPESVRVRHWRIDLAEPGP